MLKILLVWFKWLKILNESLEEDFPIVTSSHILFIYSDFIFLLYLPILKVLFVQLEWLKSLNIEGPD